MKLLMITKADENITAYSRYTLPIHRMYAEKWGADFKRYDDLLIKCPRRLMILRELLKSQYDRILHIDADIIINKNCPNIFDIVPSDTIGLVFEDKGSRLINRRKRIEHVKQIHGGNKNWTEGYWNGGILVISSMHREIFSAINGKLWDDEQIGKGQAHISYQIMKQRHKYIDLGYKWNHMSMFSEPWNSSPSRFDSYIIHYAGNGKFADKEKMKGKSKGEHRIQLIINDIEKIYGIQKGK